MVVVTAIYWITPERFRSVLLAAITLIFVAFYVPLSAVLLVLSAVVAWTGYRYFAANGWAVSVICVVQAGPLVFYRAGEQWHDGAVPEILVPLGLAYYTLRAIHYVLEAYKGTLPAHRIADVFYYMFFLPTILAGPIHRFPQFFQDMERRRWNTAMVSEGLERILYGYAKITLIANLLINEVLMRHIADMPEGSRGALYLTMIAKGLNGYFQFAGYSDVAIGFSRLLGFRVIENFNAPLIRRNVQEFWSSWHISLTSWCRDYVYSGVFSITRARWLGILAAMAVLGLWHEFTARYLVWGLYNGAGIVLWHQWRRVAGARLESALAERRVLKPAWTVISVLLTLHYIFIGFTFVQNDTLPDGIAFLGAMFGLS